MDVGVRQECVDFNYRYPGAGGKADLIIRDADDSIIFELKSFVCSADAKKIADFPFQIERLQAQVDQDHATQAIAFCTFCGYGDRRLLALSTQFFSSSWTTTPLRRLIINAPLQFLIGSFTRESR